MAEQRRRRLLKISGEVLGGDAGAGVEASALARICSEISDGQRAGVEVALVVGGGNFLRGAELAIDQVASSTAHHMGMLATVMNGLALRDGFGAAGLSARVFSAIPAGTLAERYSAWEARAALSRGEVAILVGGTGNAFLTTDTCAALRAVELDCEVLLKGTKVEGVYSADPRVDANASLYSSITFDEVLSQRLAVMDQAAFAVCQDNRLPIRVFDMTQDGNIRRSLIESDLGTLVKHR